VETSNNLASGGHNTARLSTVSSNASLMSIAKDGYAMNLLPAGKQPVKTKALSRKIKNLKPVRRVSSQIHKYILQPQNSWLEKLKYGQSIESDDINQNMDCFFVVKGAIEFTMREDQIHRFRRQNNSDSAAISSDSSFEHKEQHITVQEAG